jgi:hypothetical protein
MTIDLLEIGHHTQQIIFYNTPNELCSVSKMKKNISIILKGTIIFNRLSTPPTLKSNRLASPSHQQLR